MGNEIKKSWVLKDPDFVPKSKATRVVIFILFNSILVSLLPILALFINYPYGYLCWILVFCFLFLFNLKAFHIHAERYPLNDYLEYKFIVKKDLLNWRAIMDNKIIDGMKKEGRPFRNVMIFGYIFAILMPLSNYFMNNGKYNDNYMLIIFLVCFMFGTIGLYGWLYATKYRVEFSNKKVCLKTLFKKIELNICDVEKYTCSRYRKSVFYQFNLFIKGKKVLINTRYKDEFEKILKNSEIEQIIN